MEKARSCGHVQPPGLPLGRIQCAHGKWQPSIVFIFYSIFYCLHRSSNRQMREPCARLSIALFRHLPWTDTCSCRTSTQPHLSSEGCEMSRIFVKLSTHSQDSCDRCVCVSSPGPPCGVSLPCGCSVQVPFEDLCVEHDWQQRPATGRHVPSLRSSPVFPPASFNLAC